MRESASRKRKPIRKRVLAETLSLTKQAEAQRDLDIKKAEYLELTSVNRRRPTRRTISRRRHAAAGDG